MKRRDFIAAGAVGALGAGLSGCSTTKPQVTGEKGELWKAVADFVPRPSAMPMREIGKTGIRVSQLGFGSHMQKFMRAYEYQRAHMIREAFDLGVNLFDIYDHEWETYQYEPMSRHLKPIIKDVVLSISVQPYEGRTAQEEFERVLKLFNRDYIDLVRHHAYTKKDLDNWAMWDMLFKAKERGQIKAVGVPIHDLEELDLVLKDYPIDFVLFPYNFYHNIGWLNERPDNFDQLPTMLRKKNIGVLTMKAFAGDYLVKPFIDIARQFSDTPGMKFSQAAIRYVLNSGVNPDAVLVGMYNLYELYENVQAFYDPDMSDEERKLLNNIKHTAKIKAKAFLPDHYKWLEKWANNDGENSHHLL
jgi:predicted aldo/keto reductase-like oxidoreductase